MNLAFCLFLLVFACFTGFLVVCGRAPMWHSLPFSLIKPIKSPPLAISFDFHQKRWFLMVLMVFWLVLLPATVTHTHTHTHCTMHHAPCTNEARDEARRNGMNGGNFADCRRRLLKGGESLEGHASGHFGSSKRAGETRSST